MLKLELKLLKLHGVKTKNSTVQLTFTICDDFFEV